MRSCSILRRSSHRSRWGLHGEDPFLFVRLRLPSESKSAAVVFRQAALAQGAASMNDAARMHLHAAPFFAPFSTGAARKGLIPFRVPSLLVREQEFPCRFPTNRMRMQGYQPECTSLFV